MFSVTHKHTLWFLCSVGASHRHRSFPNTYYKLYILILNPNSESDCDSNPNSNLEFQNTLSLRKCPQNKCIYLLEKKRESPHKYSYNQVIHTHTLAVSDIRRSAGETETVFTVTWIRLQAFRVRRRRSDSAGPKKKKKNHSNSWNEKCRTVRGAAGFNN